MRRDQHLLAEQGLIEEQIFHQTDGRALVLIPLASNADLETSVMIRSGGHPSSLVRIYRAELLRDPDPDPFRRGRRNRAHALTRGR